MLYLSLLLYLALGIPAAGADEAAFLEDEQVAAVGALSGQVFGQAVVLQIRLIFITSDILFQYAGNGIGAGEDGLAFLPGD